MKIHGGHYLDPSDLQALGLRACGEHVLLHSTCVLAGVEHISLADHVRIDPFCVITAGAAGVSIGRYVHVGPQAFLSGGAGIHIADFTNISSAVRVLTHSDDFSGDVMMGALIPDDLRGVTAAPVRFGRHVSVGALTLILPGVTLGDGSAIGALSLVKTSLEPWTLYAGIPARRLRARNRRVLELEQEFLSRQRR